MIGLVYADYLDPAIDDIFHHSACDTFQNLSEQYPGEILALTDPDVTGASLWALFERCEFIFYWGHGQNSTEHGAVVLGSREKECVPVSRIGRELNSKQFFLDACGIASELDDQEFCHVLLACPVDSVDYDTSVQMGCGIVSNLFSFQVAFDTSLQRTVERLGKMNSYRLIGKGCPSQVIVSKDARESLVTAFARLLGIWRKCLR
jgi:hypothetical protein